jgi:hypothetical protein
MRNFVSQWPSTSGLPMQIGRDKPHLTVTNIVPDVPHLGVWCCQQETPTISALGFGISALDAYKYAMNTVTTYIFPRTSVQKLMRL